MPLWKHGIFCSQCIKPFMTFIKKKKSLLKKRRFLKPAAERETDLKNLSCCKTQGSPSFNIQCDTIMETLVINCPFSKSHLTASTFHILFFFFSCDYNHDYNHVYLWHFAYIYFFSVIVVFIKHILLIATDLYFRLVIKLKGIYKGQCFRGYIAI